MRNCKLKNHDILLMMATEFLEDRLGINPTRKNIVMFAKYIRLFEEEQLASTKKRLNY